MEDKKRYPVELTGRQLARICGGISQGDKEGKALVDLCHAAIAAAGLGPDGREKPLTVGGATLNTQCERQTYVEIRHAEICDANGTPLTAGWVLKHSTPAELAALRKALGVPQPEQAPPPRMKLTINGGHTLFGLDGVAMWVDELIPALDPKPRQAFIDAVRRMGVPEPERTCATCSVPCIRHPNVKSCPVWDAAS